MLLQKFPECKTQRTNTVSGLAEVDIPHPQTQVIAKLHKTFTEQGVNFLCDTDSCRVVRFQLEADLWERRMLIRVIRLCDKLINKAGCDPTHKILIHIIFSGTFVSILS